MFSLTCLTLPRFPQHLFFFVLRFVFAFSALDPRRGVGIDLFSQLVAKQVFSAPHSLTSVFGMGTGGPCAIKTPTAEWLRCHMFEFVEL